MAASTFPALDLGNGSEVRTCKMDLSTAGFKAPTRFCTSSQLVTPSKDNSSSKRASMSLRDFALISSDVPLLPEFV